MDRTHCIKLYLSLSENLHMMLFGTTTKALTQECFDFFLLQCGFLYPGTHAWHNDPIGTTQLFLSCASKILSLDIIICPRNAINFFLGGQQLEGGGRLFTLRHIKSVQVPFLSRNTMCLPYSCIQVFPLQEQVGVPVPTRPHCRNRQDSYQYCKGWGQFPVFVTEDILIPTGKSVHGKQIIL